LFNAGIRPAVNVGVSVSRVGGDAQTKAMKQVAGRLGLDIAAYPELAAFALMASDLDKSTQQQLSRGQHMQEILKQPQYEPMELEQQVMVIFAGTNGFADAIPLDKMAQWQSDLIRYMETTHPEIGKDILANKSITDSNRTAMLKALEAFRAGWQAQS
jgi:F-type H+-transporting ATPase subunit alpha